MSRFCYYSTNKKFSENFALKTIIKHSDLYYYDSFNIGLILSLINFFNCYNRHANAAARLNRRPRGKPLAAIYSWTRQNLDMDRPNAWKNLRSFAEDLKNRPIGQNGISLTAEVIETYEALDPIIAVYSPEVLEELKIATNGSLVTAGIDCTFKIVPKRLLQKPKKEKGKPKQKWSPQCFNVIVHIHGRVRMIIGLYKYSVTVVGDILRFSECEIVEMPS